MKRSVLFFIGIALLFCFISNLSSFASDEEAVKQVIYDNVKAAQEENLKDYLNTLDPTSTEYSQKESLMEALFKTFDFKYEVSDLKVTEIKDDMAKAVYSEKIIKVSGPDYKNNLTKRACILKKINNSWKIYSSIILDVKYI